MRRLRRSRHFSQALVTQSLSAWRRFCSIGFERRSARPARRSIMANVTFSSSVMARDVTVYAVAGDRGTILAIAKANKIPIPFDCQDGECGSCLIEVKHLDPRVKTS